MTKFTIENIETGKSYAAKFKVKTFHFHILVNLHFNLVSSILAILFSTSMATKIISQMIECFGSVVSLLCLKRDGSKKIPLILNNTQYQNSLK